MDRTRNKVKKEYLEIARRYIEKLRSENIDVKSAYLFGSRIKNTNHKWSDLDTCIIADKFEKDTHDTRVHLMKLRYGISDLIEPHPLTTEEFANKYNPLATEIKKTGVKVL